MLSNPTEIKPHRQVYLSTRLHIVIAKVYFTYTASHFRLWEKPKTTPFHVCCHQQIYVYISGS